ncbi:MAG: hypothetical protein OXM56_01165 [Gammaproteobacteria bacterium]|nr:hypothetical protein [Gammaproteobacteria bacterium]
MSALTDTLSRCRAELGKNTRLRLGVWVILAIIGLQMVLLQSDRLEAIRQEHFVEAGRLARVEGTLASGDWQQWLGAEQAANESLSAKLWHAESPGLAQANLQAALGEITEGLDLRNTRIRPGASQALPDAPGIWRVQMQLNATYRRGQELELLHGVATYPRKIAADRLDLGRTNDRIRLIVSAYFLGVSAKDG